MGGLQIRGVSYICGVHSPGSVSRVMRTIREELHCTSVMLIDSDVETLVVAARIALASGLDVVVRPRLPDARPMAILHHLRTVAAAAESLRLEHPGRVTLLVGTEFSLTSRGIVPGPHEFIRLALIVRIGRLLRRRIDRRVNALLSKAAAVARDVFHGPLSYGAASWESVDWTPWDLVGVNLYRSGNDPGAYRTSVAGLVASTDKPVVITEFGCGAHIGADRRGPGSFRIVNWFRNPPRVRSGHVRDEQVQAQYLSDLIALYNAEGVHGCFVFTFFMADFPHRPDAAADLDMAGFGLVKVQPDDPGQWQPKEAFHAVACQYGRVASS